MTDSKELSTHLMGQNSSDFYDHEVKKIGEIWAQIHHRYARMPRNEKNVQAMEREAVDKFAEAGFVVRVFPDPDTGFYTVEPLMRVHGTPEDLYGFDHERKSFEVNKANAQGEDFLGQKE